MGSSMQEYEIQTVTYFFILIYYARYLQGIIILFETGKGNKKRIINVTKIAEKYSQVNCAALLGVHAFTGCDSTSAFKGKGKVKAIRLLQKKENYQRALSRLDDECDISNICYQLFQSLHVLYKVSHAWQM